MNEQTHRVVLRCAECGRSAPHELRYAGRILVSSRCGSCGHRVRHDSDDLRTAYLHDLEHRLRSKPGRMVRRAVRHPVRYALSLPAAVFSKPRKMAAELRAALRPSDRP